MDSRRASTEKMDGLIQEINLARATLYIVAKALDAGDTDLELLAAKTVGNVFESITGVYEDLSALKFCGSTSSTEVANG